MILLFSSIFSLTIGTSRIPVDRGTSYLINNELLNVNFSFRNAFSNLKKKKKTFRTIARDVRVKKMVIDTEGLKALIFGQVLIRFGQILDDNFEHFAET